MPKLNFIIFFLLFLIFSCSKEKVERREHSTFLSVSAKNLGRLSYYEQMHRHSSKIKSWRFVDEQNRKSLKASEVKIGHWSELGSTNLAGRVLDCSFDTSSQTLFVASAAGHIWSKNLNLLDEWHCVNNQFRIPEMIYLGNYISDSSMVIFAGSGAQSFDGFYTSLDTGKNWVKASGLEKIRNNGYVKRFLSDNDSIPTIFALAEYIENGLKRVSIYRSNNIGSDFSELWSELGNAFYYDIFVGQNKKLYLASDSYVAQIDSLGNKNIMGSIQPIRAGGVMLSGYVTHTDENLVVGIYSNGQTDFYTKGIFGTWEFKSYISDIPFMINSFRASLTDRNTFYFGGVNFHKSTDGAISWDLVNDWKEYYTDINQKFHADIPSIQPFVFKNKEILFIATDGGVFQSNTNVDTVQNISTSNLNISQYYSSISSEKRPNVTYLGSQDQGLQYTDSLVLYSKNEFTQILAGDFGHLTSADDLNTFWAVYPGFVVYSENLDSRYNFNFKQMLWLPPITSSRTNNNKVLLAGADEKNGAYIYELEYLNGEIEPKKIDYDFASQNTEMISALTVSPFSDSVLFVMTNYGEFYKSNNKGKTWQKTPDFIGPQSQYFYGSQILCSSQNDSLVFIAGSAYDDSLYPVYYSENQGASFKTLGNELPHTLIGGIALSNNDRFLFAASEVGAFAYSFADKSWLNLSDSIAPDVDYWSVEFVKKLNIARFSTYGRGIWDFELNPEEKIYKPILYNTIPDILINSVDTVIELSLDSFFYHTGNLSIQYQVSSSTSQMNNFELVSDNVLRISPILKSLTQVKLIAKDENNYFASDNFLLNTNYKEPTPFIPKSQIKVYPNPVVNELNFSGFDLTTNYIIKIYDLRGNLIIEKEVRNNNYASVLFSSMISGIYFVNVLYENGVMLSKFRIVKL